MKIIEKTIPLKKVQEMAKAGFQHPLAAAGRWHQFSLVEQMANIGSEVSRAISWREKGDEKTAYSAFLRALELFDLTLFDLKNKERLKEALRARELFCDFFVGDNLYQQTANQWHKYFYQFAYLVQNRKKNSEPVR